MSKTANGVVGYVRLICLLIACSISLSSNLAQSNSARFLWGSSDSEGFIAQISLARGISIESAELETESQSIDLSVRPLPLEHEQWLVLDASMVAVNTAPAIQAAALEFVAGASPERQIGLIRFAQTQEILPPSSRPSDLSAWLGDYHAISNESGCLADSLNLLNEQGRERLLVRQVLAIVGEYQECNAFPNMTSPIELMVVGADVDIAYSEFVQANGGTVYRASLQTLRTRLNEVEVMWSQPVYALEGANPTLPEGRLHLVLSNGENLNIPIHYEQLFVPTSTPAPSETANASETAAANSEGTALATSAATRRATQAALVVTAVAEATEEIPAATALPISNDNLIISGGIAAAVVVVVVMILLLRGGNKNLPVTKDEMEEKLDTTYVFRYSDESELEHTDILTARELISTVRPTLAARLRDGEGNVYEIHRPFATLGRKEDSDILIVNDKQVSREHLRFSVRDDGTIWVTRLTQNPVLINESILETLAEIKDGDVLQLSPSLRMKLEVAANE
jgi:hypothetical protein